MSPSDQRPAADSDHAIEVHLDKLLAERAMTLTELAERAGITIANLSILKNGRARAIRFSTLTRLCEILRCQPGDLITYASPDGLREDRPGRTTAVALLPPGGAATTRQGLEFHRTCGRMAAYTGSCPHLQWTSGIWALAHISRR
jgi:putative transcriptional regulator